ncbi:DeoR/GlpR family DNA-binding transcription regulator [Microcella daejeonensis]|uniref:DeoR/GlpR family DNA-binding transcription regulator n=1 Tax=Microcella daejeonensis TaxID=2994971 RepID=UPI0022703AF2|nr:DeoR/GlpR family DNA-binding transcription regulator [Microcella daejeonensis]WAB84154.1 DeoR/GlpR family DNA-binding transcription regulator [Microcella daejeonensis]
MYATERQQLVERLLADDGRVSVVELARRFDVTTETVRRDLDQLESAGLLRRVHGGAVAADRVSTAEPSLSDRVQQHGAAKTAIARRALDALGAGFRGSLFLDAGTTTAAVAARLVERTAPTAPAADRLDPSGIGVVTHAVVVAAQLAPALAEAPGLVLTVLGGRVRGLTGAAVGAETVRAIEQLRPDVAVIGTNGVAAGFGLSTPDSDEAAVKSAIVRSARRVVVVADADKLGRELLVGFARLDEIDVLVTDGHPDAALAAALAEADVEVWRA